MTIRTLFLTTLLVTNAACLAAPLELPLDEQDPLFDTSFLLQYDKVAEHLVEKHDALHTTLTTSDNLKLDAVWIPCKNATNTVIAPAGFFPGRKEGMATLKPLLPDNSNLLLFDARGHGISEGSFWSNLRNYGINEYNDVIAAMNYAKETGDNKPLILLGMCAGGFHSIRALTYLKDDNALALYNVKGVILDSTFTSCQQVIPAGYYHFSQKLIPQLLRSNIYTKDSNEQVKQRLLYKFLWNFVGNPFVTLLTWCIRGGIQQHDATTRIDNTIHKISEIPITFIHAATDNYAPLQDIVVLKKNHNNPDDELHAYEDSSHANNFLKKKNDYRKTLHEFLATVIVMAESTSA